MRGMCVVLLVGVVTGGASAGVILNTGAGADTAIGGAPVYYRTPVDYQFVAGKFAFADAFSVSMVEYWGRKGAGSYRVSFHADGGDVPGAEIVGFDYATSFSQAVGWQRAGGSDDLGVSLDAGSYWIAFSGIDVPGNAQTHVSGVGSPLLSYARDNNFQGGWVPVPGSLDAWGLRLTGEVVPGAGSGAVLVFAVAGVLQRRR
jgi:hypothetical protein